MNVIDGALAFWGLGQVGVVIKGPSGTLYVDPYLTDSNGRGGALAREFLPPVQPTEVGNVDGILLTHDHIDHTDPDTVIPIAARSPEAQVVAPFTSRDRLTEAGLDSSRITVPEVGGTLELTGARITAIPSAHTELEHDPEHGFPYLGYVIEWNGVTIYHAGDTIIYDGLIERLGTWDIDVAFLPINGRDWFRTERGTIGNMDIREAAHLAESLDFGMVVPTHYDLVAANSADPGDFTSYLYRLNPNRRHKLLRPGELLYFVNESQ